VVSAGSLARECGRCRRQLRASRAQADVFAGQKCDADRLESAPDRPGDSCHGRPPLRLEIIDRTRADRSGRCELCEPTRATLAESAAGSSAGASVAGCMLTGCMIPIGAYQPFTAGCRVAQGRAFVDRGISDRSEGSPEAVTATATRRLVAILAADVAGYPRLMGADEEGTPERPKTMRRALLYPKIADTRGCIVKTTDDGMPPEKRIEFRIAINVGDIFGDGVSVASRLQRLPAPAISASPRGRAVPVCG
jgi:hypothetical protein